MKILQFPLAKITCCFIAGILFGYYLKPSPFLVFIIVPILFFSIFSFQFISKKEFSKKSFFGVLVSLISIFIGVTTTIIHSEKVYKIHYINQITDFEKDYTILLSIKERLKSTVLNQRYIASIKSVDNNKSFGKIILNIEKDSVLKNISIGTNLRIKGNFYKNRGPINPNQFDYGHYLENQQIFAQIYVDKDHIKTENLEYSLLSIVGNLRDMIIKNLEKAHFPKEELSVVIALILGQQQDISPEILKDYQYAGAVHILSVSGLHVGFILMFITFLLRPIPNTKLGSNSKVVIIIICLWLFGILAGLAPSVVRSVTMFSFIAIGMHYRRTVNIYHTLLVSMLLILLFKPSFLFDVGFQLSYIAVFFIIWLQPLLASVWQPKYKVSSYFWDIITVSFAAQIGAFPLSVYYFHQFPGLFLITNLIIIPMLSIILAIGVVVVIFAAFDFVPFYFAKALEYSILFLNKIIHWVASFEDFIFRDISFNFLMLLSCYFIIISVILYCKVPSFKKLLVILIAIICLQTVYFFNDYSIKNQKEYFVFNSKKNTIITERNGNQVTVYGNDLLLANLESDVAITSYLVGNFCTIKAKKPLDNLFYFDNKKVLLIDSTTVYSSSLSPDVLIITQSPKMNFERLLKILKPKKVVVDGSNFKIYVKRWEATCRKEKIPFHSTNEKGFYKF